MNLSTDLTVFVVDQVEDYVERKSAEGPSSILIRWPWAGQGEDFARTSGKRPADASGVEARTLESLDSQRAGISLFTTPPKLDAPEGRPERGTASPLTEEKSVRVSKGKEDVGKKNEEPVTARRTNILVSTERECGQCGRLPWNHPPELGPSTLALLAARRKENAVHGAPSHGVTLVLDRAYAQPINLVLVA
ncbi:hypothetical protein KM043_006352 [Ampulex compressa]|nr:hypothetical protein KM043_006352 [Ampulex compressa]